MTLAIVSFFSNLFNKKAPVQEEVVKPAKVIPTANPNYEKVKIPTVKVGQKVMMSIRDARTGELHYYSWGVGRYANRRYSAPKNERGEFTVVSKTPGSGCHGKNGGVLVITDGTENYHLTYNLHTPIMVEKKQKKK